MDENVAKAVERWDSYLHARATSLSVTATPTLHEWQTIRAHLLAQEAEVDAVSTELRTMRGEFAKQFKRAERAEADLEAANKAVDTYREMLVSIIKVVRERDDRELQAHIDATRITAHLSENSRG